MNVRSDYEKMKEYMEYAKKRHINRKFEDALKLYKEALRIGKELLESNIINNNKEILTDDIKYIIENINKCKGNNFDDVVGVEEFKKLFKENIFSVVRNKELAEAFGVKANCSILLVGKPGTGKSFVIGAAVNEFPEAKLFETKTTELVDALVGKTGQNIDALFNKVKEYLKNHEDRYAIVFIDEIDGIARSRTSDDKASQGAMNALLVNLTKIDEQNLNIIFVGATNIPDKLDAAFKSRFGNNIIEVPLPEADARAEILRKNLKKCDSNIDWELIKEKTNGLSGRDLKFIANDANKMAFNKAIIDIKENNINDNETLTYAKPVNEDILLEVIEIALKRREKKEEFI